MTSSTSSSEGRFRVPWGGVWAVGLFLLAELGFRLLPTSFYFTFDQGDYRDRRTMDYEAVDLAIELGPTPDVLVMGTSRAREGLQSPELAALLAPSFGATPVVRNYGIAAGRVDVSLAILERMIAADHIPSVIVLVIDASDLRDREPHVERSRMLTLGTLAADVGRNGWPSEDEMTHVLGNSLGLRMALARTTLRYRLFRRGSVDAAARGNAALGGRSRWNLGWLEANQGKSPDQYPPMKQPEERLRKSIAQFVVNPRAVDRLQAFVEIASARGIQIVLAEVPTSPPVRAGSNVVTAASELRATLSSLAGPCVRTWLVEPHLDDFATQQFLDHSHLNAMGARRFAELVAPTVSTALDAGACERDR